MAQTGGVLSVEQAMERLELSRAQVYRRVKDGGLKGEKADRQLGFAGAEVERYAAVLKEERDALHQELDRWLAFFDERQARAEAPTPAAEAGAATGADAPETGVGAAHDAPPPLETEDDKVVALGERILADAARTQSSDLYLDPLGEGGRLLYSVDEAVTEVARLGAAASQRLSDWCRGLGTLPAEGATRECLVQRSVRDSQRQYRLTAVPTALGELLHLHDFAVTAEAGLEALGYTTAQAEALRRLVGGRPGLLVVAGPPDHWGERHRLGLARELGAAGRLVVSVEHRVHFRSELLVQLEASPDPTDFPRLWRQALDMRPDYLFVDEVRDEGEARGLLEGVQSGIVVIAQVSASTGLSALRRLSGLEVDGAALGESLLACTERRVLRLLCPACRVAAADPECGDGGDTGGAVVSRYSAGPGCGECNGGWRGQRAVFGLAPATGDVVDWLASGAPLPLPIPAEQPLSLRQALRGAAVAGEIAAEAAAGTEDLS